MFVIDLKLSKVRRVLIAAAVVFIAVYIAGSVFGGENAGGTPVFASTRVKEYSASNNLERIRFLKEFGWETGAEPLEIEEVIIPEEFGEVYEAYNEIQKTQNLDLLKYKGKTVKRYSYEVKNYPESAENIRANLLVYNGMIIGGDISSTALGGFMHGFAMA